MPPKKIKRERQPPLAVRRAERELAEHLVTWRKLRGMTQAQLADRANMSRDTLARLEGGEASISVENLLLVLRALGILDALPRALDPLSSDVGRLRSEQALPERVRPRKLDG
jgi:transcriptional regulator with XRE-family HTH domain